MSFQELMITVIIGGVFILLGILSYFWGKKEEGAYYGSVSERIDVREFLDHSPGRPEPNALRTGGKICFAVGIVLLLISLGFRLWGME
jgi:glycerol-3-phosphate acyltransferase PlsY